MKSRIIFVTAENMFQFIRAKFSVKLLTLATLERHHGTGRQPRRCFLRSHSFHPSHPRGHDSEFESTKPQTYFDLLEPGEHL